MKRRLFAVLLGLALLASFAPFSLRDASASDSCGELGWAMNYHMEQGNDAYVYQLYLWAVGAGCEFAPIG